MRTHYVASPLVIRVGEHPDRRINMSQVVLRVRDLSLTRGDPPVDLGACAAHTL
jgi:hypothetical protein